MPKTFPCRKCGGTGQAPLSKKLQVVLDHLSRREQTVKQIATLLHQSGETFTKQSTINNRLRALEAMGLISRRLDDRKLTSYLQFLYRKI